MIIYHGNHAGPTSSQHWANVWCSLGWSSKDESRMNSLFANLRNAIHSANAGLIGLPPPLHLRRYGPTLNQHWNNISCSLSWSSKGESGAGALMQWLKLPAWKVGDRGFEPHSIWPSSFKETKCFFHAHS